MPRTARDKRNEFVGVIIGGWGLETTLDPNSPLFSLPLHFFPFIRIEENGEGGRVEREGE